uniref:PI3K/PI4K domain-containing protein n=1 Tax=Heterorhabditis bacteriophora TaxID=37862 RepID=A0A1I7WZR5_HETBA
MEDFFSQADGISAPKVLKVKGSDGKIYKTIWKKEDVRQDCLVEQLFFVMNGILGGEHPLRTYKVVPLDNSSGIIEFCQGTTSLSVTILSILINNSSLISYSNLLCMFLYF